MKRAVILILILAVGIGLGGLSFFLLNPPFEKLSSKEQHQRIVDERDYAIGQAMLAGDYRCCISPACTMCFMEANQWNNHTAGTCACDDFIARGEEPCPQCRTGLIKDTGISCEIQGASCDKGKEND